MYVSNLTNSRGNKTVNQFVITHAGNTWFQSYESVVACVDSNMKLHLSANWDYSRTTTRHLYNFLRQYWFKNVDKKFILENIANGTIAYENTPSLSHNLTAA